MYIYNFRTCCVLDLLWVAMEMSDDKRYVSKVYACNTCACRRVYACNMCACNACACSRVCCDIHFLKFIFRLKCLPKFLFTLQPLRTLHANSISILDWYILSFEVMNYFYDKSVSRLKFKLFVYWTGSFFIPEEMFSNFRIAWDEVYWFLCFSQICYCHLLKISSQARGCCFFIYIAKKVRQIFQ